MALGSRANTKIIDAAARWIATVVMQSKRMKGTLPLKTELRLPKRLGVICSELRDCPEEVSRQNSS
jgi:hypothetical protein